MATVLRPAALQQRLLTVREKRVATIAGVFRDGCERSAILDRGPPARIPHRDGAAAKVRTRDAPHPGVLRVLNHRREPRVVLVLRILGIDGGLAAQVLDADVTDPPRPAVGR